MTEHTASAVCYNANRILYFLSTMQCLLVVGALRLNIATCRRLLCAIHVCGHPWGLL